MRGTSRPPLALRCWLPALLACMWLGCAHAPAISEASGEPRVQASELLQRGVALARAGELTRAEQYLASAHRTARDRETLAALLAVCVRAGRLRSAIAHAEPYLHDHPHELRLLQLVATLRYALGELSSAERLLARVLSSADAPAESHYVLAQVQLAHAAHASGSDARQRVRAARRHLMRYLALAPRGSHAAEARAVVAQAERRASAR
jgi:tetratricopeptide (TPR) repeat protein